MSSLLFALLEDVRVAYDSDVIKAGVVISNLDLDVFYASVCRYENSGAKVVVVSAKEKSLNEVIQSLALAWLIHVRALGKLRKGLKLSPGRMSSLLRNILVKL